MSFELFGRHKTVFVFALLAGFVFILPDLLIPAYRGYFARHFPDVVDSWTNNGSATPIDVYATSDHGLYAGRMREASRRWFPGDPYIDGDKSPHQITVDLFTFSFIGALVWLMGSLPAGWILSQFLSGVFWTLALYTLIFQLTKRTRWSLLCTVMIIMFWDLITMIPGDLHVSKIILSLYWHVGRYQYNLGPNRMPHPALSYPPLFLATVLLLRTAESNRLKLAILSGLVGGSLAYIHSDVWTTFMGASAMFIGFHFYTTRRLKNHLLTAWGIAFLVSLPWILYNLPVSPDILSRSEVTYGRVLDWSGVWLAAGAGLFTWLGVRKNPSFLLIASVLWATAAAMQVQVVLGYTVQSFHWFRIGNAFFIAGLAAWIGGRLEDRRDFFWVSLLIIVYAAGRAAAYAGQRYPYQALRRDDETALAFLQKETKAGSRVAVLNPMETMLIPMYTRNKTLIPSGFPLVCDMPTRDILQRIRFVEHLFGIPEDRVIQKLQQPEWTTVDQLGQLLWRGKTDWVLCGWYRFFYVYTHLAPRDKVLAQMQELKSTPLPQIPAPDYLWVGPFERELMDPTLFRQNPPVYQNASVAIYATHAQ